MLTDPTPNNTYPGFCNGNNPYQMHTPLTRGPRPYARTPRANGPTGADTTRVRPQRCAAGAWDRGSRPFCIGGTHTGPTTMGMNPRAIGCVHAPCVGARGPRTLVPSPNIAWVPYAKPRTPLTTPGRCRARARHPPTIPTTPFHSLPARHRPTAPPRCVCRWVCTNAARVPAQRLGLHPSQVKDPGVFLRLNVRLHSFQFWWALVPRQNNVLARGCFSKTSTVRNLK